MKDFEGAFSDFIDQKEYDKAEVELSNGAVKESLFEIVRAAFKSGWLAAGGTEPEQAENSKE